MQKPQILDQKSVYCPKCLGASSGPKPVTRHSARPGRVCWVWPPGTGMLPRGILRQRERYLPRAPARTFPTGRHRGAQTGAGHQRTSASAKKPRRGERPESLLRLRGSDPAGRRAAVAPRPAPSCRWGRGRGGKGTLSCGATALAGSVPGRWRRGRSVPTRLRSCRRRSLHGPGARRRARRSAAL